MHIRESKGKYFYFRLENSDWKDSGFYKCRQFLNALQKEIHGGPGGDRYWIQGAKLWAIKKDKRQVFNRLVNKYLKINYQKELFHE